MKFLATLVLLSLSSASFADPYNRFECNLLTDITPQVIINSIGLSDQHEGRVFHVGFSNRQSGIDHRQFSFKFTGKADKRIIDGEIAAGGIVGRWQDDTMEESVWEDVNMNQTGYLKLKLNRRGNILEGTALIPIISPTVLMARCKKLPQRGGLCDGWFC